jgi:hypothetical protein
LPIFGSNAAIEGSFYLCFHICSIHREFLIKLTSRKRRENYREFTFLYGDVVPFHFSVSHFGRKNTKLYKHKG